MMTLQSNKSQMFYALQGAPSPVYERDEEGNIIYYEDGDGNKIPLETGETEVGYSLPVEFWGNIAMSSGEAQPAEFGLDVSQYDAILIMSKGEIPIDETSLIWYQNEPGYKDTGETLVDPNTADFRVVSVKPSLNMVKYVLKRITR
nr:MAG TPA: hypothetical protein [Caudoviricetes sp.]